MQNLRLRDSKSRKVGRANRALSAESGYTATAKDMGSLSNIPCQAACPAGTDIPGYLEAIYKGDFERRLSDHL